MEKTPTRLTLADTIYIKIREDITQHKLTPGAKINVKELAQTYGVSETPIKYALNRLITEKIIDNFPRHGMFVHNITSQEIDEVFEARLILELNYIRQVIVSVNYNEMLKDAFRRNLDEHMELVTNLEADGPTEEYIRNYDLDYQFHELILKCSGNQKVVDIYQFMNPFLYSTFVFRKQSRVRNICGVKEHFDIFDAILAEDEDLVKSTLSSHILNGKSTVGLILKIDTIL